MHGSLCLKCDRSVLHAKEHSRMLTGAFQFRRHLNVLIFPFQGWDSVMSIGIVIGIIVGIAVDSVVGIPADR